MAKKPQIPEDRRVAIMSVLVGSRAHGLETPESDADYRGVFAVPTADLLVVNAPKPSASWVEGKDVDSTSYEIGDFLHMAMKSNPSILEVFKAEQQETATAFACKYGSALQDLFPYVWTTKRVADAFGGYSYNQRKKFLDNHLGRQWKFAVAYIRVLLQGIELLSTGDFNVKVADQYSGVSGKTSLHTGWMPWGTFLRNVKQGICSKGRIIDIAESLRETLDDLAANGPFKDHEADEKPVNDFLIRIRRELF